MWHQALRHVLRGQRGPHGSHRHHPGNHGAAGGAFAHGGRCCKATHNAKRTAAWGHWQLLTTMNYLLKASCQAECKRCSFDTKSCDACACFVMLKDFENVPDGRLFVSNKGRDRFRVVNVIKEKPVLVCEVRSQGAPL